jgi:carboxyl-terminal processing protease
MVPGIAEWLRLSRGAVGVLALALGLCRAVQAADAPATPETPEAATPDKAEKAAPARPAFPPLYPVQIEHEFADPETTFREVVALAREYYYSDAVDEKTIWWAATKGLLRQLSPEEHPDLATIWVPEDFENVSDALQGLRESIGIKSSFNPADGSLTVTEVTAGGPSEGVLQPLDRILRVQGKELKGLSLAAVTTLLEGEPDTPVSLKVVRDVSVLDLTVKREKFHLQNVLTARYPAQVGYLAIRTFSQGVAERCKEELGRFQADHITRLMLDLRGNGGGVLQEGLKVAEIFLPKGNVMLRVVAHGGKVSNYVSSNETPLSFELAILVDGQTASAGEIVAAALRDECGATLVGSPTYGKASMERIFTLKNGCRVKFSTGALYAPKGRSWHKHGLTPQIQADLDPRKLDRLRPLAPELRLLNDPPLRAAHYWLAGKAAAAPAPVPTAPETKATAPAPVPAAPDTSPDEPAVE